MMELCLGLIYRKEREARSDSIVERKYAFAYMLPSTTYYITLVYSGFKKNFNTPKWYLLEDLQSQCNYFHNG